MFIEVVPTNGRNDSFVNILFKKHRSVWHFKPDSWRRHKERGHCDQISVVIQITFLIQEFSKEFMASRQHLIYSFLSYTKKNKSITIVEKY